MNKQEFISKLRAKLSCLPKQDVDERISFYSEIIDDRMEEGLSEEDAVAEIGSADEIAARVLLARDSRSSCFSDAERQRKALCCIPKRLLWGLKSVLFKRRIYNA